jgi:hypothetical protein
MKVKLTKDHSVRGVVQPADTIVEIHDGVALDLIKRGIAKKTTKPKADK